MTNNRNWIMRILYDCFLKSGGGGGLCFYALVERERSLHSILCLSALFEFFEYVNVYFYNLNEAKHFLNLKKKTCMSLL